ncbi:MAG: PorV/PorQ family protein [Ignavibacterium sp.]|uniref:PorV/PorQ family protein n=1 Tax=Ignavibacterium sp. TaxID=2651167 RepID=UPI004049A9FC
MKTLKVVLSIIIILGITSIINPQTLKTGTTAAQVLKFNVGPRAIGMGGAFTSVSNDILSTYWNPAGTSSIVSNEAFFNHTDLYIDIKHDYAAFASNLSDLGTVGLFVSVLSMDEMQVRTIENPEGTGEFFDAGALVIGVNYSRYLTENFSIGFNFKYINESIWHMSANGFAIDVGTLYKIPILNEFRIAASISNFGTKMQLSGRDVTKTFASGSTGKDILNVNLELDHFDLPLLFRFGVSADLLKEESSRLTVAVDAVHPNDHSEYINSGLEYSWNEIVFIRGGYNSLFETDSEKGLTVGFGLNYRLIDAIKLKLDYAYQDFGRLTSVHYFSFGITF